MSRRLLADGVRRRHPEYDEREVRLAFLHAAVRVDLGAGRVIWPAPRSRR